MDLRAAFDFGLPYPAVPPLFFTLQDASETLGRWCAAIHAAAISLDVASRSPFHPVWPSVVIAWAPFHTEHAAE